ncbi:glycosyltransferase family 2 protein [Nocardioides sp. BP30]|uniref:glycosyltransferase family 2 protein n=1 Tax=Nocardioides sp. BP30 TaxID=3036374 RepID=UPI00246941DF|nr:glycosyltransferase family 2 protein [Nocardioides sp. BP30]WGL50846.1 glycosyltransferase family 2 protein [Nocardioides sp. BP30]
MTEPGARPTVCIMIPAYNEEESLPVLMPRLTALADSLTGYDFTFFFVDDGSSDNTLEEIARFAEHEPRAAYLSLSRNFGKEIAMAAGIDHVDADAMVIIDADLQDPPELIGQMLEAWHEGYDDVYARRAARRGETWFKKTTSRIFYRMLQRTTRVPIQRDTGDFRLLSRRALEALRRFRESERYTKGMFSLVGFRKKEILFDRDPRAAGTTKWRISNLVDLAIEGVTSFTTAPLRISTYVGMVVSLFAFIYLLIILVRTIFGISHLSGYPSLMAVILFLGGVQLLSLGVIGEYVGRTFLESKQRPLYFVSLFHASNDAVNLGVRNRPQERRQAR